MDKKSVTLCFVIPYFGKFPNTIQFFLDSVASNTDIDCLIFTDDEENYRFPENVHVHYMSFDQLKNKIQKAFTFQISLDTPKKLCDYKPAYGFIFQKELQEYKYWGYCDVDMILGRLSAFITDSFLERFDKVFTLGHMSIFRNTDKVNSIFLKEYENRNAIVKSYKEIFQSEKLLAFDEWPENTVNINVLAEQEGLRINGDWPMVDILPHRSTFKESIYYYKYHKWSEGTGPNLLIIKKENRVFKAWINEAGQVEMKEVLYAHIQKRALSINQYNGNKSDFVILPNKIVSIEKVDTAIIKKYLLRGSLRRLFKIDELAWTFSLKKDLWKHRFHKYLKI